MPYFKNVKFVPYQFGTSTEKALHQNLTAYVDIVDQVRDQISFYQKYTILDGDRPDNLSFKLYKNTKYYWTFYIMNDKLRLQGWPLTNQKIYELVKKERANTVLTTRDIITAKFNIGSTVTGITSGASGIVLKRRVDLGQIIIKGFQGFLPTETISSIEDGNINTAVLTGATEHYNAVHHYEDSDGSWVDINPYTDPGSLYSAVSYHERYIRENDALRDIVVIKPDAIESIYENFQKIMSE